LDRTIFIIYFITLAYVFMFNTEFDFFLK